ncbi:hypothetical protein KOW_03222 [Bacillus cereus VDM006]|nr:hypothetical protein KOW_03222 [Bacillus cereus VDM006]
MDIMKRAFDALTAVLTLMLLSFIILIVALLVRFKLGSPIIFKQQRPGLHGKPFYVYKFRTMIDAKDEEGNFLPDNVRLTSFGKLLRKLSLDELPQLINVIKGDISLVGPRPLLIDERVTGVTYLDVIEALAAQNIEARPVWKPLHRQPVFAGSKYYTHGDTDSISDKLFSQGLCLPSGSSMTVEDQERVIATVKEVLAKQVVTK